MNLLCFEEFDLSSKRDGSVGVAGLAYEEDGGSCRGLFGGSIQGHQPVRRLCQEAVEAYLVGLFKDIQLARRILDAIGIQGLVVEAMEEERELWAWV
ncbi:hypothetical protein L3X38_024188 [Prunus dulcis]|uniref:Uncharacterized protein n=1 Tax=Prunus dulcis TaxID=3755 RepID=A0AAD4VZA3_PRUDU|nr:hypothetical protein L3X38_024188 [Prunus dulcis]